MSDATDMIDVVFALSGRSVPANHAFALQREVLRALPWLEEAPHAGIVPLRIPEQSDEVLYLSRRARLMLRVPVGLAARAQALTGQELDIDGHVLSVGTGLERALQPFATLHAHLVTSSGSEAEFLAESSEKLRELGVGGKLICGKHLAIAGREGNVSGYSLVVHELKPQESLWLQCAGLGGGRLLGCGIFIPYKAIADLDS